MSSATGFSPEDVLDGRYRIRRVMGSGGFGTVYLAFDEQPSKEVAIKIVNSTLVSALNERVHKRLVREAQALSLWPGFWTSD